MDDFEKAVLVVFSQDPSVAPGIRQQANEYCEALKVRPDGWRLCLERFLQTSRLEVKFWCLQLIANSVPTIQPQDRPQLRTQILAWIRDVCAVQQEDAAIKNKAALLYVRMVKHDYPTNWPGAWQELIALLERGLNIIDFFLRVLAIFDQDVVNKEIVQTAEEREQAHAIKHAMRAGDVARLAECWYNMLASAEIRQNAPHLVIDCLKVIGMYIVWIEITTVANKRFLDAITGLVSHGGPIAGEACECLSNVIGKKMPAPKKIHMFQELHLLQYLQGCMHRELLQSKAVTAADLALLTKEAELFNEVGEVLLEAYIDLRVQPDPVSEALARTAWDATKAVMEAILCFFSHAEYDVAGAVEPYLTLFFAKFKSFIAAPKEPAVGMGAPSPCHMVSLEEIQPILVRVLQLTIQRVAYPDWFQHGDPAYEDDERHIAFLEFRRSLTKIYRKIFLVDEKLTYSFIQASITQLTQSVDRVMPMEAEAVLYLFRDISEVIKNLNEHLEKRGPLAGCFVQLLDSDVIRANNWAVQLALFEIYVRYGRVFTVHTAELESKLQLVLEAFTDARGVRSPQAFVASRASLIFSRFIKLTKTQVAKFTMPIFTALKDLMAVPYIPSQLVPAQTHGVQPKIVVKGALKPDDQACLYEALASLLTAMPKEQVSSGLQALLAGPAGNLTEIIAVQSPRLATDARGYISWAARSIEAVATVSKAFTVQLCTATSTADVWEQVLRVVGNLLQRFAGRTGGDNTMRTAALFLCRRMVEVLGDRLLELLDGMLPLLYAEADMADVNELSIFVHHAVAQYQKKAQPLLEKQLAMIFVRPYEVWCRLPEESVELKREKNELGCNLLQLLKEVAARCPVVLLQPMVMQGGANGHGQELISFLLQGLKDPSETRALLLSASVWSSLLEVAMGSQDTEKAMAALPLAQLLQVLVWSTVRADHSDAQVQKVAGEAAAVLRCLTSARLLPPGQQQQAMRSLWDALVAALPGLRDEAAPRRLCEALAQEQPLKDIRAALQQCAIDWRRSGGA